MFNRGSRATFGGCIGTGGSQQSLPLCLRGNLRTLLFHSLGYSFYYDTDDGAKVALPQDNIYPTGR